MSRNHITKADTIYKLIINLLFIIISNVFIILFDCIRICIGYNAIIAQIYNTLTQLSELPIMKTQKKTKQNKKKKTVTTNHIVIYNM